MSRARTRLCAAYLAIAILALLGTWRQNLAFMAEPTVGFAKGFAAFWPALLVNRATTSITIDIFMFGLAALVWMVLEARRLGMRGVWLYFFFGLTIAISVTFPLFLLARERRLAALGASEPDPSLSLMDKVGLAVFGLLTVIFVGWCTLR